MEARVVFFRLLCVAICFAFSNTAFAQRGYQAVSQNFVVVAADPGLARRAAQLAEEYRASLAVEWLGHELPDWKERCPIRVEIQRDAWGETSFGFVGGSHDGSVRAEPMGWQMKIFGPPDRVLDAVLPHEITHTIFATHFGQPLPRWADEGACTTVEHESERQKNHFLLMQFLKSRPSRGIPFNRMFTMKQYPADILPLYAQGHSLVRYLVELKGRRHFVDFLGAGLRQERVQRPLAAWDRVTEEFYGAENLSELQIDWLKWVKQGSPSIPKESPIGLASFEAPASESATETPTEPPRFVRPTNQAKAQVARQAEGNTWYSQQSRESGLANEQAPNKAAPQFKAPNIPERRSATMSSKDSSQNSNTFWR